MLSLLASLILVLTGILLVLIWRMQRTRLDDRHHAIDDQLDRKARQLQSLILLAQQQSTRLEAAIGLAQSLSHVSSVDPLSSLEALADPAQLANPQALARTAAKMPPLPGSATADLFAANQKTLAIAHLLEQGHAVPEIARRLSLPVGEIELLLSFRSA